MINILKTLLTKIINFIKHLEYNPGIIISFIYFQTLLCVLKNVKETLVNLHSQFKHKKMYIPNKSLRNLIIKCFLSCALEKSPSESLKIFIEIIYKIIIKDL